MTGDLPARSTISPDGDETIFDRCLSTGFNPFGSGPTPIFLRHRDAEAPDADAKPCMPPDTKMRGADVEPPA